MTRRHPRDAQPTLEQAPKGEFLQYRIKHDNGQQRGQVARPGRTDSMGADQPRDRRGNPDGTDEGAIAAPGNRRRHPMLGASRSTPTLAQQREQRAEHQQWQAGVRRSVARCTAAAAAIATAETRDKIVAAQFAGFSRVAADVRGVLRIGAVARLYLTTPRHQFGRQAFGRLACFHPFDERRHGVDLTRAITPAAVRHARNEEHPIERLGLRDPSLAATAL